MAGGLRDLSLSRLIDIFVVVVVDDYDDDDDDDDDDDYGHLAFDLYSADGNVGDLF